MKVVYLRGPDWAALTVDGVAREEGHSIRDSVFVDLLREAGVEVETPEGTFCSGCGRWDAGAERNDDHECARCRNAIDTAIAGSARSDKAS